MSVGQVYDGEGVREGKIGGDGEEEKQETVVEIVWDWGDCKFDMYLTVLKHDTLTQATRRQGKGQRQ